MTKERAMLLVICALMSLIVFSTMTGCATMRTMLGMKTASSTVQNFIPSSPASQMWKVVAKTDWVVTLCLLGFAGGLFTFLNGKPKLGIAIMISCIGTLFLGLAVHRFPTWMAIFGFIGSIAGCAAALVMKHRAIIEVIKGGQEFKKEMKKNGSAKMAKVFIDKQVEKQSPTTQKLIKKIKSDLKLKGQL